MSRRKFNGGNVTMKKIRDDVCCLSVARDRFTCAQPVYLRRPTVASLKDKFKFVVCTGNLTLHSFRKVNSPGRRSRGRKREFGSDPRSDF